MYALATGMLALELAPGLAPMAFLYALGFGFTAGLGFWQSERRQAGDRRPPAFAEGRQTTDDGWQVTSGG
jgi:hypothetical protein